MSRRRLRAQGEMPSIVHGRRWQAVVGEADHCRVESLMRGRAVERAEEGW